MHRFTSIAATLLAFPASLLATAAATSLATAPAHAAQIQVEPAPASPAVTATPPAPAIIVEAPAAAPSLPTLKPGEFHWIADSAYEGPVLIAVSIPDQMLYAWRGGALVAVSTVSTGKRGHATPTGAFPILEKRREHYSNLYNNASMPFMQRLTWDGVALHAGKLPGYPASHGCIRLPHAFAERLFGATRRGGMVVVTDRPLTELAARQLPFHPMTGAWLPSAPELRAEAAPRTSKASG